jgi:RHS repeat-associated protein
VLTGSLLHLTGVGQSVDINWRYNTINDGRPTLDVGGYETALELDTDGGTTYTYTAPDGGCYDLTNGGAPPAGLNATLTAPTGTTTPSLQFWPSGVKDNYTLTNGAYLLTSSTDRFGTSPNTITYTYSGTQLTTITDTQGRSVSVAYNDPHNSSQPSTITDNSGTTGARTINLYYNGPNGALSQITDANNAVTQFTYGSTGQLTQLTDPDGEVTQFGYASDGTRLSSWTYNQTAIDSTPSATFTAGYSAPSNASPPTGTTTVTDQSGNQDTYSLDESVTPPRVTKVTDPIGHATSASFDSHNNTLTTDDALDNAAGPNTTTDQDSATYGSNQMLTAATSPKNGSGAAANSTIAYNSSGSDPYMNYTAMNSHDAQGNETAYGYTNDDLTSTTAGSGTTDASASTTTYENANGTICAAKQGEVCTQTNGDNQITHYAYDSAGNVHSIAPPAPLGARYFSYYPDGLVDHATDGRGDTAEYSYDNDDRTTAVTEVDAANNSTTVSYGYDADGNLTSRTDPTGITRFGFDALDRPTTKTFTPAGSSTTQTLSAATYDTDSNLTSYTDAAGTVAYTYDAAGNLRGIAEPGGSCPPVTSSTGGETIDSEPHLNTDKCTVFDLDGDGRRQYVYYPDGQSIHLTYDNAGQPTLISALDPSGHALAGFTYAYSNSSGGDQDLRSSQTGTPTGSAATTYTYDHLNRIKTATTAGQNPMSWTYDADGNRTQAKSANGVTTYYAYNAADQLCWSSTTNGSGCSSPPTGATTYSYDATGNMINTGVNGAATQTQTVNTFNQSGFTESCAGTSCGSTAPTYAGDNNDEQESENLTNSSGNTAMTNFVNGNLGVTEQTSGGQTVEFIRDPSGNLIAMDTYAGGTLSGAETSHYYTTDALGSIILITEADNSTTVTTDAAYSYDPWGDTTSATGTLATSNPYGYAGGYNEPGTGLIKYGDRYYNPLLGQFTQPDPKATSAGYTYAGDNPINNVDPTGGFSIGDFFKAAGAAVGIASAFIPGVGALVGGAVAAGLDATGGVLDGDSGAYIAESALVDGFGAAIGGGVAAAGLKGGAATGVGLLYGAISSVNTGCGIADCSGQG